MSRRTGAAPSRRPQRSAPGTPVATRERTSTAAGADPAWMLAAVEQARRGIAAGQSPFGAVIIKDGRIVGAGHNEVWLRTDPTAHAEVVAIQRAADALSTIDLSTCEMYTTCEPCPMCASAAHWARLSRVYFGATIADAAKAGFHELTLPAAEVYRVGRSEVVLVPGVLSRECAALFDEFLKARGRVY